MLALRTQVTCERADKENICQGPQNVGIVSLRVINNISPGQWERTLRDREPDRMLLFPAVSPYDTTVNVLQCCTDCRICSFIA